MLTVAVGPLACVHLLATWFAMWIGAVIVAAAAGIVGGTLIAVGLGQMPQVAIAPARTMATIDENIRGRRHQPDRASDGGKA